MKRLDFVLRGLDGPEEVRLEGDAESWRFTRNGETRAFTVARLPDARWSLLFADGRQVCGRALPGEAGSVAVATAAGPRIVHLDDPLHDRLSHGPSAGSESGDEEVRALMPGRVVEVRVRPGDEVEAGAVLLVLEAMKMQNEIRAASRGVVSRCQVAAGDAVEGGGLMLAISKGMNKTPK
jgi:3-methylcrotonyl-CoA carboxylase alpha subunit